jgi:alpha-tubulin suppressor-like RCC1 family protein
VGGAGGAPSVPVAVALGAFHSCATFDDGSLRCWGEPLYIGAATDRTIGDDEPPAVLDPVQLGGKVVQIAASWYDTCALLDSGTLRCFGSGLSGALGYGNLNDIGDDELPASAGDVSVGRKVTYVSAGPYHTCACLDDGAVRCWGRNSSWQLGYSDPQTIGDDEAPASAGNVNVGGFAVQVAAGLGHTCALLANGKVRCWGSGGGGRLGYGNQQTIGDDESPASAGDVELGGAAIQIVAGATHTCALLENRKVRCWGSGIDGRLGFGNALTIGDDETPASAGDLDVGGPVEQLAAGDFATCALLVGGAVRCWGSAEHGELGYGDARTIGDDEMPAAAGDIDLGGPATNIDVGYLHACAILASGAVRCWGRASTGALGYGNLNDIGDDESPASAGDVRLR